MRMEENPSNPAGGDPDWVQRTGVLDCGNSFVRTSLAYQPKSKPCVGVRVVRIQCRGRAGIPFPLRSSAIPLPQDNGQRHVGFDEIRVECQRLSGKADDLWPRCFRRNSGKDRSEVGIGLCQTQVRRRKRRVSLESILEIRNALIRPISVSLSPEQTCPSDSFRRLQVQRDAPS